MPELPDVEGQRRKLSDYLPGAQVTAVDVLDAGALREIGADDFRRRLLGARFRQPRRHGKWLILPTDGPILLIHNGMTGRPYFVSSGTVADPSGTKSDRWVISTDHGELHYSDLRKLRGVWLVDDIADVNSVTGQQGLDALDISSSMFRATLQGRRGGLKATLMDQRVIAGLGNMLSDEICWRAGVHPARIVSALDDKKLNAIYRTMRRTLESAVKQGRIPRTRTWLNSARQRDPAPCPRCQTTLRRSSIAGRTSIWCPRCQLPSL